MFALALTACTTPGTKTAIGAGVGAAAGAGIGALVAKSTGGKASKGAAYGAAAGLAAGGLIGNYYDKLAKELAQIADVEKTDNGVKITLKGDILFDTGKSALTQESVSSCTCTCYSLYIVRKLHFVHICRTYKNSIWIVDVCCDFVVIAVKLVETN